MHELISNLSTELSSNFNCRVEREKLDHLRGYFVFGKGVSLVLADDLSDIEVIYMMVHGGSHIALGHLNKLFMTMLEVRKGAEELRRGMVNVEQVSDPTAIPKHQTADILTASILNNSVEEDWNILAPNLGLDTENQSLMIEARLRALSLRSALGTIKVPMIGEDQW